MALQSGAFSKSMLPLSVPACQLYALCSKALDILTYLCFRQAADLESGAVRGIVSSRATNRGLHSKERIHFNAYPNTSVAECQRRRQTLQNWEKYTW